MKTKILNKELCVTIYRRLGDYANSPEFPYEVFYRLFITLFRGLHNRGVKYGTRDQIRSTLKEVKNEP